MIDTHALKLLVALPFAALTIVLLVTIGRLWFVSYRDQQKADNIRSAWD